MTEIDVDSFWNRFDELRKASQLTLDEVSEMCGNKKQKLKEQRSDGKLPSLSDTAKYCDIFHCSLDWLTLGIEGKKTNNSKILSVMERYTKADSIDRMLVDRILKLD